jgi:hypothetical protein
VDRISASRCGVCLAVGGVFLGKNVFLERLGFATWEEMKRNA